MLVEFLSSRSLSRELRDFCSGYQTDQIWSESTNLCITSLEAKMEEATNAILCSSGW